MEKEKFVNMKSKPYILQNLTPKNVGAESANIASLVKEYGLVVLPGFFRADKNFEMFLKDVEKCLVQMCAKYEAQIRSAEIGNMLTQISMLKPEIGRIIADLGTQPNKYLSFNTLKFSSAVAQILNEYFGPSAVILTPPSGDTLHFFPPGNTFHRYNLPPHQDYPYLMQSPDQLTFYLGLSVYEEEVGGLRVWEKSHVEGLLPTHKNSNGNFEIGEDVFDQSSHVQTDIFWNPGDLGIFDSLLCHASIPNASSSFSRIVQIFRYSNIDNDLSRSYDFYSTTYGRRSIAFEDIHSDFYNQI